MVECVFFLKKVALLIKVYIDFCRIPSLNIKQTPIVWPQISVNHDVNQLLHDFCGEMSNKRIMQPSILSFFPLGKLT